MAGQKIITELPQSTVTLITATQIATSVSNIVKELVENSLDAGASIVRVKLEDSGLMKIEVTDNGSGVDREEVKKMALAHFTSKIRKHQDLEALTTYGFRGEALAAMAAVAKLSVTTKTANDPVATTYFMDSTGQVVDSKPCHLSQGTQVTVGLLFWNVPVRKERYRNAKLKREELIKVEELLMNFGLIHPQIHLSLHNDSKTLWQKIRAADMKSNIQQILGHAVYSHMEFVDEDNPVHMFLMIPKRTAPLDVCFRQKSDRCFTFVNQRPVVSKDIEKLMKELYAPVQEANQKALFPTYVVSLHFPGDEIDVNLEPNKSQVLMRRQAEVVDCIRATVGRILGTDQSNVDVPGESREGQEPTVVNFEESQFGDVVLDDELFRGFEEPFTTSPKKTAPSEKPSGSFQPPVSIAVGSAEWSRGLATDSDGNIVHPVKVWTGHSHFAKRLSDPIPPSESSALKRARMLSETVDTSRIVGSQPSLLEMVNGKVRKKPDDSFGEYCKEMRNELLSQNPLMSFNELSQHLESGWKNLNESNKEKYENRAEINKQRHNGNRCKWLREASIGNSSLDRYLHKTPRLPAPVFRPLPDTRSVSGSCEGFLNKHMSVVTEFSVCNLKLTNDTLAGGDGANPWRCLRKLADRGWLCTDGHELMAVNFVRLYESILFQRLVSEEHVAASRFMRTPIVIDPRTFGDPGVWEVIISLATDWETADTRVIVDPRVVSNGFGIRIRNGSYVPTAEVFKTPAAVERDVELDDVVTLMRSISNDGTVHSCRPERLVTALKMESVKLAGERRADPDEDEICNLLYQWLSSDSANLCLHGCPVVWSYTVGRESSVDDDGWEPSL